MVDRDALRALWDFSDPAGSEQRIRARRDAATGADEAAVLGTQVARALGLQGRYAEAHAELDRLTTSDDADRAVSAAGEVGAAGAVALRVALERGRLLRDTGDRQGAAASFRRAHVLAEATGQPGLGLDALHMLALLPEDPAEQERLTREALALAQRSTDDEALRWVAPLLNNLGMVLHDRGDLDTALAVFEEAVQVRAATAGQGRGDPTDTAVARWMVAWTLRLLGRSDEALALQQDLAREHEAAGRPDPFVHDELAVLHADRGEPAMAAEHQHEAARLRRTP